MTWVCACVGVDGQSRECYSEYEHKDPDREGETTVAGGHPVRRGVLRDVDEMEKLMDNVFGFELGYAGVHAPVRKCQFQYPNVCRCRFRCKITLEAYHIL